MGERVAQGRGRNDFDLVTPIYDGLASLVFAGAIRRSQLALLPELQHANRVLIIGGGTGWFLLELLRRTQAQEVFYVELSKNMIDRSHALVARQAPEALSRVHFVHGTEASLSQAEGTFDVIATNFFLACFDDHHCSEMIVKLHRLMRPGGRWYFVDFEQPNRGWRRWASKVLFKVMFTFFNIVSDLEARRPPDYDAGFRRVGLKPALEENFYAGMIRSKLLVTQACLERSPSATEAPLDAA